jgi:hypothetical protein
MGFDIYGMAPKDAENNYFRNNVWWWRRLWNFVCTICPNIINDKEAENGHTNSGQSFSNLKALMIAARIEKSIENGTAKQWKKDIDKEIKKAKANNKKHPHGDPKYDWNEDYPFTITNLKEFAKFCRKSGGFEIH